MQRSPVDIFDLLFASGAENQLFPAKEGVTSFIKEVTAGFFGGLGKVAPPLSLSLSLRKPCQLMAACSAWTKQFFHNNF